MRAVRPLAMQSRIDGKQSQRLARLLGLVNRAGLDRHGHGIGLISAGIVELALDQNRDRNQRALAALQLQNRHRPRAFHLFFLWFRRLIQRLFVVRAFELWPALRRAVGNRDRENR